MINNNVPEISVLMSCYNGAHWLSDAIDSVLSQTFKNFELILVDDGSKDETWKIIQNYALKDKRIVPVSKQNTGLADSLNVGISRAKGKWIARLDQDDLCEKTRLQEQRDFVHNHPDIILLGSGFTEITENNNDVKRKFYLMSHKILVWNLEHRKRFFPHSSAFYRTDIVREIGCYNTRISRAEDLRLWLEFSLRGKIAYIPKLLIKHRRHSNQMSLHDSGKRQFYDAIASIVSHLLKKSGHKDPSVDFSEKDWNLFLDWIEKEADKSETLKRFNLWVDVRDKVFFAPNKLIGLLRIIPVLFRQKGLFILILEKIFGISLPQNLKRKWINKGFQAFCL